MFFVGFRILLSNPPASNVILHNVRKKKKEGEEGCGLGDGEFGVIAFAERVCDGCVL